MSEQRNGMDEWQALQNEKIRLMESVDTEVHKLIAERNDLRAKLEIAEAKTMDFIGALQLSSERAIRAEAERDKLRNQLGKARKMLEERKLTREEIIASLTDDLSDRKDTP